MQFRMHVASRAETVRSSPQKNGNSECDVVNDQGQQSVEITHARGKR